MPFSWSCFPVTHLPRLFKIQAGGANISLSHRAECKRNYICGYLAGKKERAHFRATLCHRAICKTPHWDKGEYSSLVLFHPRSILSKRVFSVYLIHVHSCPLNPNSPNKNSVCAHAVWAVFPPKPSCKGNHSHFATQNWTQYSKQFVWIARIQMKLSSFFADKTVGLLRGTYQEQGRKKYDALQLRVEIINRYFLSFSHLKFPKKTCRQNEQNQCPGKGIL